MVAKDGMKHEQILSREGWCKEFRYFLSWLAPTTLVGEEVLIIEIVQEECVINYLTIVHYSSASNF